MKKFIFILTILIGVAFPQTAPTIFSNIDLYRDTIGTVSERLPSATVGEITVFNLSATNTLYLAYSDITNVGNAIPIPPNYAYTVNVANAQQVWVRASASSTFVLIERKRR